MPGNSKKIQIHHTEVISISEAAAASWCVAQNNSQADRGRSAACIPRRRQRYPNVCRRLRGPQDPCAGRKLNRHQ